MRSERSKGTLFITLEPIVKEAFYQYALSSDRSASAVGRQVIIDFLIEKGVLTERMVLNAAR
jgi:hypothetical protein